MSRLTGTVERLLCERNSWVDEYLFEVVVINCPKVTVSNLPPVQEFLR